MKEIKITILEATDRVGGRIYSYQLKDGTPVDMGASWLYGMSKNPLAQFCKDVAHSPTSYESMIFGEDGELVEEQESEKAYQILQAACKIIEKEKRLIKESKKREDISVGQLLKQSIEDRSLDIAAICSEESPDEKQKRKMKDIDLQWSERKVRERERQKEQKEKSLVAERTARIYQCMLFASLEVEVGASVDDLSLLSLGEREKFGDDDELITGGMEEIPKRLARDIPILFNWVVKSIRHNLDESDESETSSSSLGLAYESRMKRFKPPMVELTSLDGRTIHGNCVIVTVPLGILKRNDIIKFDPPLSTKRQLAIKSLGFGFQNKILLLFERTFWPFEMDIIQCVNGVQKGMTFFINYFKFTGKPILVCIYSSKNQKYKGAKEEKIILQALDVLEELEVVKGPLPRLVEAKVCRWDECAYFLGSNSFPNVGYHPSVHKILSEPQGNLFFAGEHTISKYWGTVHGAYLSGAEAASSVRKWMAYYVQFIWLHIIRVIFSGFHSLSLSFRKEIRRKVISKNGKKKSGVFVLIVWGYALQRQTEDASAEMITIWI
eukprot:TRINITY_DN2552_c1_g5_i2.p1 TRINITY_DN2552_c1_g5~~TRINITY_DN2552_c1_g5_i2.p1  ORF type:complete len:552 (+),score=120.47 TRINITY_DN2552_c1_g5_i2:425-2080(+)